MKTFSKECLEWFDLANTHREKLLVGLVQFVDRPIGAPVDAVEAKLL